ncbi:MAG: TIGR02444 family protein [Ferrovibrio sp.]|uniref:TIGR02444 family protein n=1 Tax=Ferrovibrio sp. TaxID=1917215 RepID=UPI00261EDD07|nr:TIGR02444 family protein [Ferrovibrio sp.]MCW0236164.1 TIGR02444 family protein [Ferrovibrio sp.]
MTESDSGPKTAISTENPGQNPEQPAAGFWAFSLSLYDRPGAAEACLALQDGFRADVNLLLLGFWRARRGYAGWAETELDRVEAAAAPVNAVLGPLRDARRALKALRESEPTADALYVEIKALELKLEQVAQAWLAAASRIGPAQRRSGTPHRDDEIDAAAAHLAAYLERIAPDNPQALQFGADLLRIAFT